jgi:serine/threonine protein kinase
MDGHVRITDFGLSKDNFRKRDRASSFCGSPEYMSPDMLGREYHTRMVDFYSLGALLYELLTGLPPFYSHNRDEMYWNIVNKELTNLPNYLSKEAIKLLKGLLAKNPEQRLGFINGLEEVKSHEFLKGVNWDLLKAKKIKPPNKMNPVFDSQALKTEYFDPEYIQMSPRLSCIGIDFI